MGAKKPKMTHWSPTNNLRWRVPVYKNLMDNRGRPILEQEWVCRETGESEWQGIPVVENDAETGELL